MDTQQHPPQPSHTKVAISNEAAILGFFWATVPIIGLILAIIGCKNAGREGHRTFAVVGLIGSILTNLFWVIWLLVFLAALS